MSTLHVENPKGLSSGGNANKIIVPSGQTLVPSVGQVIHTERQTTSTDVNVTSLSYTDAWTVNYTPKLTTSNVMFHVCCSIRVDRNGYYDNRGSIKIVHNGTDAYELTYFGQWDYGNHGIWNKGSFSGTTEYSNTNGSQVTWKLQIKRAVSTGGTSIRFGEDTTPCGSLVITEVVS